MVFLAAFLNWNFRLQHSEVPTELLYFYLDIYLLVLVLEDLRTCATTSPLAHWRKLDTCECTYPVAHALARVLAHIRTCVCTSALYLCCCASTCALVHMYLRTCTSICTLAYLSICVLAHSCILVQVPTHLRMYLCTCVFAQVLAHLRTCASTCPLTHLCTCALPSCALVDLHTFVLAHILAYLKTTCNYLHTYVFAQVFAHLNTCALGFCTFE